MFSITEARENSILRLNYGILFEKETNVHFTNDVWMHTFQIRMPVKKGIRLINPCTAKEFCENFNKLANELNLLQFKTIKELNETVSIIKSLIPKTTSKGKSKNRKKKQF